MPSPSSDDPTITQVLPVVESLPDDATPGEHAEVVGLVYVNDDEPGIRRVRKGRGFTYVTDDGERIGARDRRRERLEALAIPPAWTDVWICAVENGHIQATGIDDAGRKQYRYHPAWRSVRDATKFHRLKDLGTALPRIRERVDSDLRAHSMTHDHVLAIVVALLDETLIRIGSDARTGPGGAIGLTTLRCEHVEVHGTRINLSFPSKGGQDTELELRHPRLARQLLKCEEIPGQQLFSYEHGPGDWRAIDSGEVNEYLRSTAGVAVTAKDFRTWGGTVAVAETLHELGSPESRRVADRNVLAAIDEAAERLGNTRVVCRASYVDPRVPKAYLQGEFEDAWDGEGVVDRLTEAERAVLRLID